jgi:uncharacterized protein YndB with AHSA1/START domain
MVDLHLVRETTAPPEVVWDVVTDFAAYAGWMPLTRMHLDEGPTHPGWGFAGVSGLGPLAFRDSMLVTRWEPPTGGAGVFRVVKTGRLLGGWVQATFTPRGTGSTLDWRQDLVVRPLPPFGWLDPPLQRVAQQVYGRALDAMVARAEERAR